MQSTERLTLEARAFPCGCHPQRRWYFSRLDIGKPRTRERIGERARGSKAERPWLAREGRAKLRMPANDRDRDREERILVRGRKRPWRRSGRLVLELAASPKARAASQEQRRGRAGR